MSKNMINKDLIVANSRLVSAMINGNVIIKEGGKFTLDGMVNKNVTLEYNAKAKIYGIVKGDVINNGGDLQVFGKVHGSVITNSGETGIDIDAKVGKIVEK